ncbi:hypothetical protein PFISCL1PPCAC_18395, partial [Pristionchus fissidentatus]
VFKKIFNIYNSLDRRSRYTLSNVTAYEKKIALSHFTDFLRGLYEYDTVYMVRDEISVQVGGMAYFRTEVLPVFVELLEQSGQQV